MNSNCHVMVKISTLLWIAMALIACGGGSGGEDGNGTDDPRLPGGDSGTPGEVVAAMLDAEAQTGAVRLDWADTGASSYNLIYATAPDCDTDNYTLCPGGTLVLDVTAPHTETGLTNGQNYWFYLESEAGGVTALSNEVGARPDIMVPNDSVSALAIQATEGTTYLGGAFTRFGLRSGHGVLLNAQTGQARAFPLVNGNVLATAADASGGFYIGGDFTEVGGKPRNGLAQIRANGTLTDWNPDAGGTV
ncbi:MAG: hypothetical protein ACQEUC_11955, partial [Pseudomonadota bacterium]